MIFRRCYDCDSSDMVEAVSVFGETLYLCVECKLDLETRFVLTDENPFTDLVGDWPVTRILFVDDVQPTL